MTPAWAEPKRADSELDKAVLSGELDAPGAGRQAPKRSTLKTSGEPSADFTPLLAPPPVRRKTAITQTSNVFHGRLRGRQTYQTVNTTHSEDFISRLDADGGIERLYARPLSLSWSGNVSYRDGNSFSTATDFRRPRARVYRVLLSQKFQSGGFGRFGRFIPNELSGLGYLDGAQVEGVFSPSWRLGGALAARPDRLDLDLSAREWLVSGYATLEAGDRGRLYYSGTAGLFQTLFLGEPDELALLYDHRADLGAKLNFYLTSQADFNVGAAKVRREAARLTRLDAGVRLPLARVLALRAGLSHYERPDTAAERDLSGGDINLSSIFNGGYWRYFAGASQNIPWDATLDEEVFLQKNEGASDTLWRVSVSRRGLSFFSDAQVTAALYNLNPVEGEGYGMLATAYLPFARNQCSLNLTSGFRYSGKEGESKAFRANDVSAYLDWRLTHAWRFSLGITQVYQDYITSTIADAGLSYRW